MLGRSVAFQQSRRDMPSDCWSLNSAPAPSWLGRPRPVSDFRHVLAVLAHILLMLHKFVAQHLLEMRAHVAQSRHAINHITGKVKPIEFIHDSHVERRSSCTFFFVPMDMEVVVTGAPVGEPMYKPGVAMVGKHHWSIGCEDGIKVAV